MVCNRCVRVVQEELENIGLNIKNIKLGEVELHEEEKRLNHDKIAQILKDNGFELLDDRKALLIEKIKNTVIELIHQQDEVDINVNFSNLIQEKLKVDYHYLSTLFSATEGITIEKYIILQRIERVKEFLIYNELSLSQIADQTGYSSVAHVSAQFKKVTGLTPSTFKKLKGNNRKPLDKI
jgi:AraC-like DNA-binding protein